jgi:two-component system, NarL family, sensor histidine kinase DesK
LLALHLRHLRYALRGERPPRGMLTLSLLAMVNFGAVWILGAQWLPNFALLAISTLIVAPGWWALVLFGAIAVAAGTIAFFGNVPSFPGPYILLTVVWRGVTLFMPVWLVASVRRLDAARRDLRDRALVRERLRIDDELRGSLGPTLESIALHSDHARDLANTDPDAASAALKHSVEEARAALAAARRMVAGYREVSLRAELDAAETLLQTGGVSVRVDCPAGALQEAPDERLRGEIMDAVTHALTEVGSAFRVLAVSEDEMGLIHARLVTDG